MLNIGAGEILVIGLVALIVVGPEQLPSLIRQIGRITGQVRTMTDGLKKEFMSTVDEAEKSHKEIVGGWTSGAGTADDPVVPRGSGDLTTAGSKSDDDHDFPNRGNAVDRDQSPAQPKDTGDNKGQIG